MFVGCFDFQYSVQGKTDVDLVQHLISVLPLTSGLQAAKIAPMEPTLVTDLSLDSLLVHWLVLEKNCPLKVEVRHDAIIKPPYYQAGDVLIYDAATLVQFLQERYPGEQLLPPDPVSRAQIRQACSMIGEPDVDVFSEVEEILDTGSEYLAGRAFTLLDIYVGVWLSENYTLDNSSVRSYWEKISKRPAYMEASK